MKEISKKSHSLLQNNMPENSLFESKITHITNDYSLHWHNHIRIGIVMNGEGIHIHNGISTPLKRGNVYILRITDYHELHTNTHIQILNLLLTEQALPEELLLILNSVTNNIETYMEEKDLDTLLNYAKLCEDENKRSEVNRDYIKNLIESIFIFILRLCNLEKSPKNKLIHSFNTALIYMQNHFRDDISLNILAEAAHYTPSHFSNVFHREMGCTYSEYLNELRIKYAKQLLTTTGLKAMDVCFQSGFNTYYNFFKTFKKHTSLTPDEYRKQKMMDKGI